MTLPSHRPLIAFVTASASRSAGGLFQSVRRTAQSLVQSGSKLEVFALEDGHIAEDLKEWKPIVPRIFPAIGQASLGYGPRLGQKLFEINPDIVHQHGIWQLNSAQVSAWRRQTGRPVMISPRGMLDPWALGNSRWKKLIAKLAYEGKNLAGADCLHALNRGEARSMREFGLKNPIAIIPNATDLPEIEEIQNPAKIGYLEQNDRKILLYLSRIHPKKGIYELVEAWSVLQRENAKVARQWCLVLAGWDDGGHLHQIREAIRQNQLETNIFLPGPLFGSQKDAIFRSANAFILPSYSEGLPISVLEAWSYGVPVLMTEACNLPEGFIAGAAYEISTRSSELAEQLADILTAPDLAQRGLAGRELVRADFNWLNVARKHMAVYEWMLRGGTPPDFVEI